MFFVDPDPFLMPSYRMSPFMTSSITVNNQLPENDLAIRYLNSKFGGKSWKFTQNGRDAITTALNSYSLSKNDVVTVITTSQNVYISSCVTKTIEQFCKWNREVTAETKVILVNHEFGFPFEDMEALLELNIPIIEDCCTTFFSHDENHKIGSYGDFSTYSLPKFFSIQVGGILVSNKTDLDEKELVKNDFFNYVRKVLSNQLEKEHEILYLRNQNYHYALSTFESLGFEARFQNNDLIVPYALLLKNNSIIKDLNQLKEFLNQNGIQNSVFYGEDAFFIANHQSLTFTDIDFMYECVVQFISNN